jgi:ATP-binding cassette subfamily B protein
VCGVTLDIPAGSAVALVGETGSGKSTLADLLMGLIDADEGSILIDGVPLSGKNRRRWQRSIAHVPQAIFVADASIAQNIALGRHEEPVDPARVVEAAEAAQLHDFVISLPEGYDTFVGERGIRLSGGQRQRLGIARAIYKQTPVLVLDEATSALDEETEAAVMEGIHGLGGGRTLIVIAHRLSTIARCDRVFRLHEGRIVDSGPLTKIVDSASRYGRTPATKARRRRAPQAG